jgi:NAD(P)H-dependent FMN reductase
MKKVIAFAGTNSKESINKQLVNYASSILTDAEVDVLDLNDFELPIYSIDLEKSKGIPGAAQCFLDSIKVSDGILISLAEHNGAYTTAFKNIFDWMTRIESKIFFNKPMLLMATAPGGRGGLSVLDIAKDRFPRHDANIIDTFSLPFFGDNFSEGKIVNEDFSTELEIKVKKFQEAL